MWAQLQQIQIYKNHHACNKKLLQTQPHKSDRHLPIPCKVNISSKSSPTTSQAATIHQQAKTWNKQTSLGVLNPRPTLRCRRSTFFFCPVFLLRFKCGCFWNALSVYTQGNKIKINAQQNNSLTEIQPTSLGVLKPKPTLRM